VGDHQRHQRGDFRPQGVYAMSLEYLLLTFIALNGSRMWINSARERVLTRFLANGGDDDRARRASC
jgi:hypothetical protein